MRSKVESKRMAIAGAGACVLLTAAVWWFTPPKPTGCARHRDCPPTARRCFVDEVYPAGVCGRPCEGAADCETACCRPTAAGEGQVCAPSGTCG